MEKLFNFSAAEEAAEFGEPMPDDDEAGLYTDDDQSISGLGIDDSQVNDEEEENNINELLREINSGADQEMSDEIERERKQREEYLRQEEEAYQKRLASVEEDYNRKRYEAEQKAKAERLKREEEERLREEEEERLAKENTFFGKLTKVFRKKPKTQKPLEEVIEQEIQPKTPAAEPEKEQPETVVPEETAAPESVEEQIEAQAEFEPVTEEPEEPTFDFDLSEGMEGMSSEEAEDDSISDAPIEDDSISDASIEDELADAFADVSFGEPEKEGDAKPLAKGAVKPSEEETEKPLEETKPAAAKKEEEKKPELVVAKQPKEEKTPERVQSTRMAQPERVQSARMAKPEKKSIFSLLQKPEKQAKPAKPVREKPAKTKPAAAASVAVADEPDWKYIALHDDSTGMLNSRAYHETIKTCGNQIAVVFFDINNLKYVNDKYSHQDGDLLIKNCASIIQKYFGEDKAYRIGGDEFVVILQKQKRGTQDMITENAAKIHNDLQDLFKKNEKHIPHAMSIGFAIGDGKVSIDDIIKAADASMYRNKKAYKQSHPELNAREEQPKEEVKQEKPQKDHDELLPKEQQALKSKIQKKHTQADPTSTKDIIRQIQKKSSEIRAILIADPNFNSLFVITDMDEFFNLITSQNGMIDYSYLYVVWEGGSQYFGSDEYYDEVTDLFKEIADGLLSGRFRSEKDIHSIKGINIFRHIYI